MDWRYNTIWREQLPDSTFVSANFDNTSTTKENLLNKSYIFSAKFKSKHENLIDFPAGDSVDFLYIGSSNIKSFNGLSRFGNIKRLEAHDCFKLESDSGLAEIAKSLQWLHISQSKKFTPSKDLFELRNLRVLCLNMCGPIQDLEFLYLFPNLLDFRFVDTNVLSGDLTPLIKHPTICSAGFINKRHYNLKDTEIDEHLQPRWTAAIEKAYKGNYETYRYSNLDT